MLAPRKKNRVPFRLPFSQTATDTQRQGAPPLPYSPNGLRYYCYTALDRLMQSEMMSANKVTNRIGLELVLLKSSK